LNENDEHYYDVFITPVRKCADYLPTMGGSQKVDFTTFQAVYADDPFYHWVGLDTAAVYAAHRTAGGMTSIYRQIGIGSERLLREIIKDELGLTPSEVVWRYEQIVQTSSGIKTKTLTLDGRIDIDNVTDRAKQTRVSDWILQQQDMLSVTIPIKGAVFEVRQGYKSADSKRQNADIENATQALARGYLPVLTLYTG
jgi:hypothetical protein